MPERASRRARPRAPVGGTMRSRWTSASAKRSVVARRNRHPVNARGENSRKATFMAGEFTAQMTTDVSAARTARGRRRGAVTFSLSHNACYIPIASAARRRLRGVRSRPRAEVTEKDARSTGTLKVVLRNARRHGRELPCRKRRDPGISRPERGRKDHDDAHDHGLPDADGRQGHAERRGRREEPDPGQALAGLPA